MSPFTMWLNVEAWMHVGVAAVSGSVLLSCTRLFVVSLQQARS